MYNYFIELTNIPLKQSNLLTYQGISNDRDCTHGNNNVRNYYPQTQRFNTAIFSLFSIYSGFDREG